jgi:hypothetical protein
MNPGQTLIARTAIREPTGTYLRRSGQGSLRSSLRGYRDQLAPLNPNPIYPIYSLIGITTYRV